MAKRSLTLLLCAGLLSGCSASTQNDFSLELYLKAEENSEDSNSQIETLEINGTDVDYTWTYEGYHPNDDFDTEQKESFELTDEQIQSLKLFIKDQGLNQTLTEEKSTGEFGDSVELTLRVEIDGTVSEVAISGMSALYGSGENGRSNLDNFAAVESAQDLISTVKDLGGLYDE